MSEDGTPEGWTEHAAPQMGPRAMETFAPLTAEDQPTPSEDEPVVGDEWWMKFSDGPHVAGNAITYQAMNVSYYAAPPNSITDAITVNGYDDDGASVPPWTETLPVVDEVVGRQSYDRVVYLPSLPPGQYTGLVELDVGRPDRTTNADVRFTVSADGAVVAS